MDHNPLHKERVLSHLKNYQMDGQRFCSLNAKDCITLQTTSDVCSMRVAVVSWKKIYRLDLPVISLGTPTYLPLKKAN